MTKTLLATTVLFLAPGLAMAQGCNYTKEQQAMSCAAGSAYDESTRTCVPTTS
ncbi:hypothetical protein AADZ90_007465 [Aestuariibius sp. 2305UL40-4]|uniref:hypothetical protein n=1 Tax=Aestuariibius violaceus TaxID=3234132 RepID=UPI00345E4FA0